MIGFLTRVIGSFVVALLVVAIPMLCIASIVWDWIAEIKIMLTVLTFSEFCFVFEMVLDKGCKGE